MPLKSVLDALASRFDCEWSYSNGAITIERLVTRVFEVRADPSIKQITSEVSGATPSLAQSGAGGSGTSGSGNSGSSGDGSDAGGGSNQQTSVKIDLDVWKEIDSTLAALVPTPGHFVTQRAAGVVTVVAPPATMRRVASYFEALNRSLSARIAVEITAIYINTDRNDDFGISLNALYCESAGLQAEASNILVATSDRCEFVRRNHILDLSEAVRRPLFYNLHALLRSISAIGEYDRRGRSEARVLVGAKCIFGIGVFVDRPAEGFGIENRLARAV